MRLRLYHHSDGTRVAYREVGSGPPLAILHSAMLTHQEFAPAVEQLASRYRVVLPDLPLHGDSEAGSRHPYTIDWFAEVIAGFAHEVLGPRPLIGGHAAGAEILLHALHTERLRPRKLVLMPSAMHSAPLHPRVRAASRLAASAGVVPGVDRLLTYAACAVFAPRRGLRLSARAEPRARDLFRQAFVDVPGNRELARSWAKCARRWPSGERSQLLALYPRLTMPVLLLWADRDRLHPVSIAEEALSLLPDGELRVLSGTGYLIAYDDPVGVAREISAFCG
ncbi:MAG: alpha/beta fold hydrolase [Solirubrobacteraceae bacterium]